MRFRLQALVNQGQPEELDVVPKLVRPRAVLAVVTLVLVIAAVVVWSFLGNLPRTVTVQGLVAADTPLQTVQSPVSGFVVSVSVQPQQQVSAGAAVVTVVNGAGQRTTVPSPFAGQAITVSAAVGQAVEAGTPLLTVQQGTGDGLHVSLFATSEQAAQLGPGMRVDMTVDSAPSAAFGLLRGTVQTVAPYPLTSGQALALLGNDLLADQLVGSQVVRLVTVVLTKDSGTTTGYAWTTHGGPPFPLQPQTLLSAQVRTGDEHPVHVVFGR